MYTRQGGKRRSRETEETMVQHANIGCVQSRDKQGCKIMGVRGLSSRLK